MQTTLIDPADLSRLVHLFDILAAVVFAVPGALLASRKGMDVQDAARVRRARVRVAAHLLHAKTFVVDGEWFTVGSMKFDNRSMALNDEATLMVLDRTLGR